MQHSSIVEVAANVTRFYLPYELSRYLLAASLFAGIVWLLRRTQLRSRKIQAREATRSDFNREFISSLMTCLWYLVVAIPLQWALRNDYLPYGGDGHPLAYNLALLAFMILGHDAYFYWTHRAMHTRLLYRHFHRHHHRSVTPQPWTAYSFAAPEAIVNALFLAVWLLFVPTPHVVVFSFLGVQIVRNVMAHAGLELHPRWWLRTPLTSWISTTTHHDLHHGGGFNTNYGFWFTYWDRLMGTEHPKYRETFERVTADPAPTSLGQPVAE